MVTYFNIKAQATFFYFILSIYNRYPEVISRVQNSSEALAEAWSAAVSSQTATSHYLTKVLIREGLGIKDVTEEEVERVKAWKPSETSNTIDLSYIFADMVSRRALIGVSCL